MTIQLPEEAKQFVKQQMATGHYADESEVLTQALALLQRQQMEQIAKIQAGVKQGREDIAAGRYFEVNTPADAEKLQDEIHRRAKELSAQRDQAAH